jgi:hypothetical protein
MMASREMQAWIARLEGEKKTVTKRNKYLAVLLALGVLLLLGVAWGMYSATVRTYAVLDDVSIARRAASQGRVDISFRVLTPGKVFYRRTSGRIETELVDYFSTPGEVSRSWSWGYEPGRDIDVKLWYRGALWRKTQVKGFPTFPKADIVVLIDATGSMDRSIAALKEKCVAFSEQLKRQAMEHRFALVGFGDTRFDNPWLDKHEFTSDVGQFRGWVEHLKRFDGGDLPESALDALEEALALPLDPKAMRLFYLVTDAEYHEPTKSGHKLAEVVAQLGQARVQLHVFCRPEFEKAYRPLLVESGKFEEIENFGKVLSEGRILED